jgi:hypothetical protein
MSFPVPGGATFLRAKGNKLGRPATLTVAASNSSVSWRDQADYLCTGTSDDVTINAAMAGLPSQGGAVLLSDGTFTISSPLIPVISNTRLLGQGLNATLIQAAAGANCSGYQYDETTQAYNLIFCAIQGMTFNGNYNSGAGNSGGYGCHINYTNATHTFWDFYLRDVWFKNWANDGFYSTSGHGYVLDHVLGEYNGGNGCTFAGGFTDSPPRIVNGTFKLNGGAGISVTVTDAYVGHNEISSNSGSYGLVLAGSGCKAVGNQIINNTGTGVYITGAVEGVEFTANTVEFNTLHGLLLDDASCTVTGNFFASNSMGTANTSDEINLAHGTYSAAGNVIMGNIIDCSSQSRYGINAAVSTDTALVCIGNRIIGAVTAPAHTAAADTFFLQSGTWPNTPTAAMDLYLAPSGATAETNPRSQNGAYTAALTSQLVYMSAIPLPAGLPVNNLGTIIGSTGFSGVSHGWLALCDSTRTVRAVTADQTSSFGSANTALQLAVATPYTIPSNGQYYLAVCVTASGMGTLPLPASALTGSVGTAPALAGTSSSSQTTPPAIGTQLATLSAAGSSRFYGYTA